MKTNIKLTVTFLRFALMGILYYVYGFLILRKESPLVHRNLTIGSQDSHCNVIWRLRRSAQKGKANIIY